MNWLALVPASAEKAPAQAPEQKAAKASPLLLTVASIAVRDGVVSIQDQSTSAEHEGLDQEPAG
jgi:hypothetical protein